ncbi:MAG: glycoside hydrolase family 108 protein [Actinobacteria bacterium]|nr:glycoside hydrolase family 108 protein [Actinomycetota bacterium]
MAIGNFAAALRRVLVHEGGWANHPADPGGPTMKGVTQRVYDAYREKNGKGRQTVRDISDAELQAIYRLQYANAIRFDELPAGVDYCVFDGAVNSGPPRSAIWLQKALGAAQVDGQVGVVTIEKAKAADPAQLINAICDERMAFLRRLRTWSTFGPGWTRRVAEVRRVALAMATGAKAPKQTKMDAEETGKALEKDIKVTETPEGKSGTEQTTGGVSGGLFYTLTSYFDTASEWMAKLSGLPENVTKIIIGAVSIAAGVVFVGLLARAGYGLYRIWRDKRAAETERESVADTSVWREKVIPAVRRARKKAA